MIKNHEPQDSGSMARLLGSAYAHLQHTIDRTIDWGFSRMKETGDDKTEPAFESSAMRAAARAGKGAMRFLGAAGDAYFRTYEELKQRKKKKTP